jgi:hypothetical protein
MYPARAPPASARGGFWREGYDLSSLRAAAATVGDPCRLLAIQGADHFDLIDPRAAASIPACTSPSRAKRSTAQPLHRDSSCFS